MSWIRNTGGEYFIFVVDKVSFAVRFAIFGYRLPDSISQKSLFISIISAVHNRNLRFSLAERDVLNNRY